MGELVLVGLGLFDEKDLSLRGLQEIRSADSIFAELYTSLMEGLRIERLEELVERKIVLVSRKMLEEDNGKRILEAASRGRAALLVPGDPLIATTHIDLRIRARDAGIRTRVIHGSSIMSAAIGLSGLQNYKFGRSVTIPFTDLDSPSETPYNVLRENREIGLHTLCFLDLRARERQYMTINEALEILLTIEEQRRESVIVEDTLIVGLAKVGSRNPIAKADFLNEMLSYDFGKPPHTLVFPGSLHFVEAEALVKLVGAPDRILGLAS